MQINFSWSKIKGFIKVIKKAYPHLLAIITAGGFVKAAAPFLVLYFSAAVLNKLIAGRYDEALMNAAFLIGSQFIAELITSLCDQREFVWEENADSAVKQMLSSKSFELEYEKFEMQETRDALRRAHITAMGIGGFGMQIRTLYFIFQYAFSIIFSVVFTVILLLQVDDKKGGFFTSYWSTIVLVLIYVLLVIILIYKMNKLVAVLSDKVSNNDRFNSIANYIDNIINNQKNAKDIRIFKLQDTLIEKYRTLLFKGNIKYIEMGKDIGKNSSFNAFILDVTFGIAYIFIGAKALYGVIPIGDVILYAGAINKISDSFINYLKNVVNFLYRSDILDAFVNFINMPSMSYDGTLPIEKRNDGRYIFEFHDVSFSYPDSDIEVLSHVNLKFNIGQKLALVGRNGAGKTTLVKLLCRLYEPTEGYITLNDIDIRKYKYEEYVQAFSVVFQDFAMFSMNLDENIAGSEEIDYDKLDNVLMQVELKERVDKMKDGVSTHLYHDNGEGVDISGGEAQRIAIARALYKDAPFIILDEPTAALDPIAEAEIYENFNKMINNKTALYISHRMSSCKFCDDIVVLDHGKVAEYGTHDELLSKNGIYAELYNTQAQYYE